jgi:SSS family solute:Na+ symporter
MPDTSQLLEAVMFEKTNFSKLDWVIVIGYPLISLGIGLYVRRLIKNMKDFVVAGQGLGVWLGIASMTGTELGLITVMYNAQKGFTGAFAAFHIALAAGLVTFFVGISGFIVFRLREMQVMTIPEYYERRFDRKTRILGGIMMALGGILNMGLFLKVGSMFLVGITGLSSSSVALPIAMGLLIGLVLVYTCLGGMISVVIADYVQFVVLSCGLLLASGLALYHLGWANIFDTVQQEVGQAGFDPTIAGGEFGVEYILWMAFLGLVSCGIWPTSVARALSMDSPQAVKRQYMLGSVSFLIRFLIPCLWGVCALVFVLQNASLRELFFPAGYPPPETLPDGVTATDNLYAMPVFLGRILPVGIIGVITAGMLAAFMSTHDSYLLCWSSVLTQDVVAPICESRGREMSGKSRILLTRLFIVLIGAYVLWWGLFYEGDDDIWDYMATTGSVYFSGAFALLVCGLYWKRASSTGAFLALLAGWIAIIGLGPVQDMLESFLNVVAGSSLDRMRWLDNIPGAEMVVPTTGSDAAPRLSFSIPGARVGLVTIGFTVLVMVLGSLFFPDREQATDSPNDLKGDA